jgi:galactosamine-6-phosphate isomerase
MKIFVSDTYQNMSKKAADEFIQKVQALENPLICPASGDSPAGLYNELVKRVKSQELDISNWLFVGLDEWAGMNAKDEGSCRYHLDHQLFDPLQITDERICFFDGRANDLRMECERIESFIDLHGGIEVAILGLGVNGHVGMNEPGTRRMMRSHVADIAQATQKMGQKYFKKQQVLTQGITLGIATLMEARHVLLLVSGKHKAEITHKIIEDQISEDLPASLLRNHPSFKIFLDQPAAEKIIQF